jgi:hypothetical protein
MVLAAVMTAVPAAAFAQTHAQVVPPPKAQKKLPEAPSITRQSASLNTEPISV